MSKPGIPAVDANTRDVLSALKENVETLTGIRGGKIKPLAATASLEDVISKINEIVVRLMR